MTAPDRVAHAYLRGILCFLAGIHLGLLLLIGLHAAHWWQITLAALMPVGAMVYMDRRTRPKP